MSEIDAMNWTLDGDNLLTAARRVLTSIRVDDAHGGLLSTQTVKDASILERRVEAETRRVKTHCTLSG